MKIGLIDNDLCTRKNHSFPNLAIMKLSSWHKKQGDDVKLISFDEINPYSLFQSKFDIVFVSKVFSDTQTPNFINSLPFVKKGGSGFYYDLAEPLPYEIEHSFPDYSIYDNIPSCNNSYYKDYSIGFLTRGCIRQCTFCINRNSKKVEHHSNIEEFYDNKRPYIMLLDDNITAYSGFFKVFERLNNTGSPFVFKQGMDFRLLTEKKMKVLWNSNYYSTSKTNKNKKTNRTFHFAFDNIEDYDIIEKKLRIFNLTRPYMHNIMFYVLVGYDRNNKYDSDFFEKDFIDLLKRIDLLFKYSAYPYIMIHKDVEKSYLKNYIKQLKNLCNVPMNITSKTINQALLQSKYYDLIDYLQKNHNWFLDIKYNSKRITIDQL